MFGGREEEWREIWKWESRADGGGSKTTMDLMMGASGGRAKGNCCSELAGLCPQEVKML